jgi:hypothetical protein
MSYLAAVPQLPDYVLRLLDGRRKLSCGEQQRLNRRLQRITREIRQAREREEARTGELIVPEPPHEG